jgi:hypothetical protein
MRKVFIVVAMFLSIGITHGQTKNKFYQYLPKDYQLEDVNGELGPAVDEDFDKDFVEFARSLEEKEKEKEKEQEFDCPICLELFDLNSPNLVKSCCARSI